MALDLLSRNALRGRGQALILSVITHPDIHAGCRILVTKTAVEQVAREQQQQVSTIQSATLFVLMNN